MAKQMTRETNQRLNTTDKHKKLNYSINSSIQLQVIIKAKMDLKCLQFLSYTKATKNKSRLQLMPSVIYLEGRGLRIVASFSIPRKPSVWQNEGRNY